MLLTLLKINRYKQYFFSWIKIICKCRWCFLNILIPYLHFPEFVSTCLHVIFIHEKNIVYTYLFLIMLITLITSGSLNDAFVLNANDMPIKVMFIWTFWYLIWFFLSSYELVKNFQSFGQMVKGHSRDLDGKSKGKTEQARKVWAKPVGRNQLGVKMQLSPYSFPTHKLK